MLSNILISYLFSISHHCIFQTHYIFLLVFRSNSVIVKQSAHFLKDLFAPESAEVTKRFSNILLALLHEFD